MQQSEDLAIRRMIIAAVDKLPQAPADLRTRTLARFRSEAVGLTIDRATVDSKRVIALTLGFLPAIVAWPLAATLGIERPLSVRDVVSQTRSLTLLSRLLKIA